MKLKRLIFIVFLFVAGCAIYPTNPGTLKATTSRIHDVCLNQPIKQVFERVHSKMSLCYTENVNGAAVMPTGGGAYAVADVEYNRNVLANYREAGTSELILHQQNGLAPPLYPIMVELSSSEQCETNAKVYVVNMFWERYADNIVAWLNGSDAECP